MKAGLALVLSCLSSGCATQTGRGGPSACALPAATAAIAVERPRDAERHEYFVFKDEAKWWAPAPEDDERAEYRAALIRRLGGAAQLSPRELLLRQRAVHTVLSGDRAREAENIDAVLAGQAEIGPASCLEWRLFQWQARRFPMLARPTEFMAYVLRGHGEIRVYVSGADRVGGRLPGEVRARVLADVAAGFVPVAHLHNHPFMFDRTPGDRTWATAETVHDIAGALAPSMSDVQVYRGMREEFGLRAAWVTNGLDTSRLPAAAFAHLASWP
jgi:hypothetical protein